MAPILRWRNSWPTYLLASNEQGSRRRMKLPEQLLNRNAFSAKPRPHGYARPDLGAKLALPRMTKQPNDEGEAGTMSIQTSGKLSVPRIVVCSRYLHGQASQEWRRLFRRHDSRRCLRNRRFDARKRPLSAMEADTRRRRPLKALVAPSGGRRLPDAFPLSDPRLARRRSGRPKASVTEAHEKIS